MFLRLAGLAQNVALRVFLSPAVLGVWNLVAVIQGFVQTIDLGFLTGGGIELPVLEGGGRTNDATTVRSTTLWSNFAQGGVIAAVLVGYVAIGRAHGDTALAIVVAAAVILISAPSDALTMFHQAHQSYARLSAALALTSIIGAILLPVWAYTSGLHGLLLATIVEAGLLTGLLFISMRRENLRIIRGFSWPTARRLVRFGLLIEIAEYPHALFVYLDTFAVLYFSGTKGLGIYATASLFFLQAANLPNLIGNVFVMRAYSLTGAHVDRQEIADEARRFLLTEYLVIHPVLICLLVQGFGFLATELIPKYAEASSILSIMVLAIFFVPQTTVIRNFWMLDRRIAALTVSNIVGVASMVTAIGGTIAIYGHTLTAIALGSVLGYAGYYLYILFTLGVELWGARKAVTLGAHAFLGFGVTALVIKVVPAPSTSLSISIAASCWHLVRNLLLSSVALVPLAMYGERTTRFLDHFRRNS